MRRLQCLYVAVLLDLYQTVPSSQWAPQGHDWRTALVVLTAPARIFSGVVLSFLDTASLRVAGIRYHGVVAIFVLLTEYHLQEFLSFHYFG